MASSVPGVACAPGGALFARTTRNHASGAPEDNEDLARARSPIRTGALCDHREIIDAVAIEIAGSTLRAGIVERRGAAHDESRAAVATPSREESGDRKQGRKWISLARVSTVDHVALAGPRLSTGVGQCCGDGQVVDA